MVLVVVMWVRAPGDLPEMLTLPFSGALECPERPRYCLPLSLGCFVSWGEARPPPGFEFQAGNSMAIAPDEGSLCESYKRDESLAGLSRGDGGAPCWALTCEHSK